MQVGLNTFQLLHFNPEISKIKTVKVKTPEKQFHSCSESNSNYHPFEYVIRQSYYNKVLADINVSYRTDQ